jgi:hypothetical protein
MPGTMGMKLPERTQLGLHASSGTDTGRRQLAGSALAPDAGPLRVTASQAGLMARAVIVPAVRVRGEPVLPRSKVRAVTGPRVFRCRRDGGRFRLCR